MNDDDWNDLVMLKPIRIEPPITNQLLENQKRDFKRGVYLVLFLHLIGFSLGLMVGHFIV